MDHLGFTISIADGMCRGAQFSDIKSSVLPPRSAEFDVQGVSLACSLKWSISSLILKSDGAVDAAITDSKLLFGFAIDTDRDDLVRSVTPTSCSPDIRISELHFSGHLEGLLNFMTKLLESTIVKAVNKNLCSGIDVGLVMLSDALRNVSDSIRPFTRPLPPPAPPHIPKGSVDFTQNQYVKLIDYLLDDVVGVQGPLGINKIIDAFTNGTGSFSLNNLSLSAAIVANADKNVTLGVTSINISHLNTWQLLDVLRPKTNFTFDIRTALQYLNVSIAFFVDVAVPGLGRRSLHETGILSVAVTNMSLASSIAVGIDAEYCAAISSDKLLHPDCLQRALRVLNATSLIVDFLLAGFSLAPGNTSDSAARGIDAAVTTLIQIVSLTCRTGMAAFVNGVVGTTMRDKVNSLLYQIIDVSSFASNNGGSDSCTVTDWAALNPIDIPDSFIALTSSLSLIFMSLVFLGFWAWRKHKFSSFRATLARSLSLPLLHENSDNSDNFAGDMVSRVMGAECEDEFACLLLNTRVPFLWRVIPFCLLFFNIALFVSANVSIGCSVKPVIRSYDIQGTETLRVLPSLFDFTLQNTVKDMWTSGDYSLSILVAVFSGIWPYLKIVIMLGCMLTPPSYMSASKRERVIMFIDAFGKWSNLDSFVMTMMMCAFHISLSPSSQSVIPFDNRVLIDVFVDQEYGFSVFLIASCMSLVLCHVILHVHRVSVTPRRQLSHSQGQRYSLRSMCSPICGIALSLLLPLVFCLVGAGVYFDSFDFTFSGAVGVLYKFIGVDPSESYSILSVGLGLPSKTYHPSTPDIPMLQAAWLTFAVGLPMLHLVALFVLFFMPLSYKTQRSLFHAVEVIGAWSSLEARDFFVVHILFLTCLQVAIVSIMAALAQLSLFTSFMVGDKCDLVNKLLKEYVIPVFFSSARSDTVEGTVTVWLATTLCASKSQLTSCLGVTSCFRAAPCKRPRYCFFVCSYIRGSSS